jgi:hypothetical protein
MADIPFTRDLGKVLHIPHVAQNAEWDTSVFVCNPSSASQTITITFYDKQGGHQTPYTATIPPKAAPPIRYPISFPDRQQEERWLLNRRGSAAFALYMNTSKGGKCYAGIAPWL